MRFLQFAQALLNFVLTPLLILVGKFYLWICAANLPVVINEMERDEQLAVINRLRQVLESKNSRTCPLDHVSFTPEPENMLNKGVFMIQRNKNLANQRLRRHSRTSKQFINNFN